MIIAGRKITRHSSLSFFVCFVFGLAGVSYTQLLLNGIDEFHGLNLSIIGTAIQIEI